MSCSAKRQESCAESPLCEWTPTASGTRNVCHKQGFTEILHGVESVEPLRRRIRGKQPPAGPVEPPRRRIRGKQPPARPVERDAVVRDALPAESPRPIVDTWEDESSSEDEKSETHGLDSDAETEVEYMPTESLKRMLTPGGEITRAASGERRRPFVAVKEYENSETHGLDSDAETEVEDTSTESDAETEVGDTSTESDDSELKVAEATIASVPTPAAEHSSAESPPSRPSIRGSPVYIKDFALCRLVRENFMLEEDILPLSLCLNAMSFVNRNRDPSGVFTKYERLVRDTHEETVSELKNIKKDIDERSKVFESSKTLGTKKKALEKIAAEVRAYAALHKLFLANAERRVRAMVLGTPLQINLARRLIDGARKDKPRTSREKLIKKLCIIALAGTLAETDNSFNRGGFAFFSAYKKEEPLSHISTQRFIDIAERGSVESMLVVADSTVLALKNIVDQKNELLERINQITNHLDKMKAAVNGEESEKRGIDEFQWTEQFVVCHEDDMRLSYPNPFVINVLIHEIGKRPLWIQQAGGGVLHEKREKYVARIRNIAAAHIEETAPLIWAFHMQRIRLVVKTACAHDVVIEDDAAQGFLGQGLLLLQTLMEKHKKYAVECVGELIRTLDDCEAAIGDARVLDSMTRSDEFKHHRYPGATSRDVLAGFLIDGKANTKPEGLVGVLLSESDDPPENAIGDVVGAVDRLIAWTGAGVMADINSHFGTYVPLIDDNAVRAVIKSMQTLSVITPSRP